MKIYITLIFAIFYLCIGFGFFLPYTISSNHTEIVIAGIATMFIVTPIVFKLVFKILTKKEKK